MTVLNAFLISKSINKILLKFKKLSIYKITRNRWRRSNSLFIKPFPRKYRCWRKKASRIVCLEAWITSPKISEFHWTCTTTCINIKILCKLSSQRIQLQDVHTKTDRIMLLECVTTAIITMAEQSTQQHANTQIAWDMQRRCANHATLRITSYKKLFKIFRN